jgi:hypothetical protein
VKWEAGNRLLRRVWDGPSQDAFVKSLEQPRSSGGSRNRNHVSAALGVIVVAAVTTVSFLPSADKRALHTTGRLHSWGHLIVFSVVGYLAGRSSRSLWARVLAFLGAVIFGFAIEAGEHLVYGIGLEWKDVLVDALGVVAGTLGALAFRHREP